MLVEPLGKIFFDFIRQTGIDLPGGIFAFSQPLVAEHIAQPDNLGSDHHSFGQVWWNKNDHSQFTQYHISGHYGHGSDAGWMIDTYDHRGKVPAGAHARVMI